MDRLNFDGSCMPNPGGRMGCGWVIQLDGKQELLKGRWEQEPQSGNTNNRAEYTALLKGIQAYLEAGGKGPLLVLGDSQLVIRQLRGEWAIKNPGLERLVDSIRNLLENSGLEVNLRWVPREENMEADGLAMPETLSIPGPLERTYAPEDLLFEVKPALKARIKLLNDNPSPGFKDFMKLKVGGRDKLSARKLPDIQKSLQEASGGVFTVRVAEAFSDDERQQAVVLRWFLRGLALELAIRKVSVDLEVAANVAKGKNKKQ